jgi:hypothetical protein
MKIVKKIFKYVFFLFLTFFVGTLIFLIIDTVLFGYDEVKHIKKPTVFFPFKDSIINHFEFNEIYYNRSKDSLSIINYDNKYKIVFWKIEQYSNIPITNLMEKKEVNFKQENLVSYSNVKSIGEAPVEVDVKMKLPNKRKLNICFNNENNFINKLVETNYHYYYLNFGDLMLSTSTEYYDLRINKQLTSEANVLIFNSFGRFCIILLYAIDNNKINSDVLLKIVNVKDL